MAMKRISNALASVTLLFGLSASQVTAGDKSDYDLISAMAGNTPAKDKYIKYDKSPDVYLKNGILYFESPVIHPRHRGTEDAEELIHLSRKIRGFDTSVLASEHAALPLRIETTPQDEEKDIKTAQDYAQAIESDPNYQALIHQVNQSHGKKLLSGRVLLMAYADNRVRDIEERLSISHINEQIVLPHDAENINEIVNKAMPQIIDMYSWALVMSGHMDIEEVTVKPEEKHPEANHINKDTPSAEPQ
jgi:hypothetical protein